VGLVVDFVGVLRELRKALQFDSSDVSGVIEDLDVLLADFKAKIADAEKNYLDASEDGDADERLERVVYGRFLEPEARKAFFDCYKDIEALWEILSSSPELRDHIATFKRLAQLYAAVRNAYANKVGYEADLAYKTRRLVQENATQEGLGRLTKSVTFDLKTLEALRGKKGSDEGKVFNLVRGLQKEMRRRPQCRAGSPASEGSRRANPERPCHAFPPSRQAEPTQLAESRTKRLAICALPSLACDTRDDQVDDAGALVLQGQQWPVNCGGAGSAYRGSGRLRDRESGLRRTEGRHRSAHQGGGQETRQGRSRVHRQGTADTRRASAGSPDAAPLQDQ
jgi:hypothetical protein